MAEQTETFDIYADLGTLQEERVAQEVFELREKLKKTERERDAAQAELERTRVQIREVKAENTRLRKNISALFKTAQQEIARKDQMLADARRAPDPAVGRETKRARGD